MDEYICIRQSQAFYVGGTPAGQKQGEEMTGNAPLDCLEFKFDRRAFRDDNLRRIATAKWRPDEMPMRKAPV